MSTVATLDQRAFRVRTDTGTAEGTPTWAAAENTSVSLAVETTFRLRFSVNNTGTAASTTPTVLRVSKNAGAYTAVTTTSGATLGAQSADASSSADEAALTTANNRLSAGTGTAAAGTYDETGSTAATITNGQYKELEYGLILKAAGAATGDTFDFRLYNNTTAFTTYTQTPRITCVAAGTDFGFKTTSTFAYADYNSAGHTTSSATITAAQSIGDLHVVFFAVDNFYPTDQDEPAVTSLVDSAGNTYTKAAGWSNSQGTTQAGVYAAIWYCQLTNALTTSNTITLTWATGTSSRDAVVMSGRSFTVAGGKTVSVEASATGTANATSAVPSLNPTTANIECLRFRINGCETNTAQSFAGYQHTAGWSGFGDGVASSGTPLTSILIGAECRVSTGTGDASSPSALVGGGDQVGVYVAFKAGAAVDTEDDLLANNVSSASSVTQPALQQEHAVLANDVASASSVSPAAFPIAQAFRIFRGMHTITLGAYGTESAVTYDTASDAIFAAFTTPPSTPRKALIDACVVALKAGGVWTKLDELNLEAAADSQAAKINWINPGTYNLTEVNAPAFTADQGFTGASTKYLDSGFNATTAGSPKYVKDSATVFAWSLSNIDLAAAIIGVASSGAGESLIYPRNAGVSSWSVQHTTGPTSANTDGSGLFTAVRRSSSASEIYRNSTSFGTSAGGSNATLRSSNFIFLARSGTYWTGQIAAGGFGQQLSAAEVTTLYNALRTYLTGVGVP